MARTEDAGRASFESNLYADHTPWLGPLLPEIESIDGWPDQSDFRNGSVIAVILIAAVTILVQFV